MPWRDSIDLDIGIHTCAAKTYPMLKVLKQLANRCRALMRADARPPSKFRRAQTAGDFSDCDCRRRPRSSEP